MFPLYLIENHILFVLLPLQMKTYMTTYFEKLTAGITSFSDFICGYPMFLLLIGGGLILFAIQEVFPFVVLDTP